MADTTEKKIDPFDVEALEKSLNDSATRVSTIWVSFLIFALYLLTAATTVTHKQLFLDEPLKLPVLNIDLPLKGFFFLAPILFVILHAYVLMQVILLGRTAATYNEAIDRVAERGNLSAEDNASLRQRLANTLFAQIFAGSPREREGAFGRLLTVMAWITLAIAPVLILLTFQFMFLPYHSGFVTWSHRLLLAIQLIGVFLLWPLILNGRRNLNWRKPWRRLLATPSPRRWRRIGRVRTARWYRGALQVASAATCLLFVIVSLSMGTFPGEPHVNLFTATPLDAVQCQRWVQQKFEFADMRFDRLLLARVDVVDDEKLEKIQQATAKAGEQPWQGERTRILRDRDFNCGEFSGCADLRRIDLSGARLRSADFASAKLEGASLVDTQLQGASLYLAQLHGASLSGAQLQGAYLARARLQAASLENASLQGAHLNEALLQGASLRKADIQGASLYRADLRGASFDEASLQGASFEAVDLRGASFDRASLQGVLVLGASLQGSSLSDAELQGAIFGAVDLEYAACFVHGSGARTYYRIAKRRASSNPSPRPP